MAKYYLFAFFIFVLACALLFVAHRLYVSSGVKQLKRERAEAIKLYRQMIARLDKVLGALSEDAEIPNPRVTYPVIEDNDSILPPDYGLKKAPRKDQIILLSQSGLSANQIARRLQMSSAEVDIILKMAK